jgi:hypothetical protein
VTCRLQGTEVDEVRTVRVDEGIETEATAPWTCTYKQNGTHKHTGSKSNDSFLLLGTCHINQGFSQVVVPVKSWMLTPGYPLVLRWHHSRSASFADFFSLLSFSSSYRQCNTWFMLRQQIYMNTHLKKLLRDTALLITLITDATWCRTQK